MIGKLVLSSLLLEASLVSAFPTVAEFVKDQQLEPRIGSPEIAPFPEYPGRAKHATFNHFDPKDQLVSVSGKHKYMIPKESDIRGPCAGLNAAANHGYIPRDGIATAETINTGLFEAYGLALDATLILQTATMFFDGDPFNGKWSIGYASPKTAALGKFQNEMIGNETGICQYGHLKTEGDASITRGDWLAPTKNNNCASYPEFTQELFDLTDAMEPSGLITPRVMARHQYNRKQHSIRTNPNYFSPAYAGVAFTFGAHMFAWELLANHSAEEPRGFLTKDVFSSFFSYHRGKDGKLISRAGLERIPANWYKRSSMDQWNTEDIVLSTAQQCASYPDNCQVGGNTGKVNSFSGVNLGDITGGFINSASDLSDPAKLGCFLTQAIQADVPSFLDKTFGGGALAAAKALIPKKLAPALVGLGTCPGLPKGRSVTQYGKKYPGGKHIGGKAHKKGLLGLNL